MPLVHRLLDFAVIVFLLIRRDNFSLLMKVYGSDKTHDQVLSEHWVLVLQAVLYKIHNLSSVRCRHTFEGS